MTTVGLGRPTSAPRAVGTFVLAFTATILSGLVLLPFLNRLFAFEVADSRFAFLRGDLVALALSIIGVAWFAAAFGEELAHV